MFPTSAEAGRSGAPPAGSMRVCHHACRRSSQRRRRARRRSGSRTRACSTAPARRRASARRCSSATAAIERVGERRRRAARRRARRSTSTGRTLMPGLVDAHAHVMRQAARRRRRAPSRCCPAPRAHIVAADLREALRWGITTIRDVGSYGDVVVEARQAMRLGAFRGPRLLTCGRIVSATSPGGRFFAGMYREADGPDDVRRAVREQLRHGADFIKVMTTGARSVELEDPDPAQLTREEIATLVEEAHRHGLPRRRARRGAAPAPRSRSRPASTRSSTACTSTSGPTCSSGWPRRGRCSCRRSSCFYGVAGIDARRRPMRGPPRPGRPLLVELAQHNLEQADLHAARRPRAGRARSRSATTGPVLRQRARARADGPPRPAARRRRSSPRPRPARRGARARRRSSGRSSRAGSPTCVVVDGDPLADPGCCGDRERIWLVLQLGEPVAGAALERPWLDWAPAR